MPACLPASTAENILLFARGNGDYTAKLCDLGHAQPLPDRTNATSHKRRGVSYEPTTGEPAERPILMGTPCRPWAWLHELPLMSPLLLAACVSVSHEPPEAGVLSSIPLQGKRYDVYQLGLVGLQLAASTLLQTLLLEFRDRRLNPLEPVPILSRLTPQERSDLFDFVVGRLEASGDLDHCPWARKLKNTALAE